MLLPHCGNRKRREREREMGESERKRGRVSEIERAGESERERDMMTMMTCAMRCIAEMPLLLLSLISQGGGAEIAGGKPLICRVIREGTLHLLCSALSLPLPLPLLSITQTA